MFRTHKFLLIVVLIAVLLGVEAASSAQAQMPPIDRMTSARLVEHEGTGASATIRTCFGQPPMIAGSALMGLENCSDANVAVTSFLMPPMEAVTVVPDPGRAEAAARVPVPSGEISANKLMRMPVPTADAVPAATKVETMFIVPLGNEIRVRTRPVNGSVVDVVVQGEVLQVMEAAESASAKIGSEGEWIAVRTLNGTEGYTAAWLYTEPHAVAPEIAEAAAAAESTPLPTVSPQSASSAVFYVVAKSDGVRLRERPVDGVILDVVAYGESVQVVESVQSAQAKVGVEGEWLQARTQDGTTGYTAAWLYEPLDSPVTTQAAATTGQTTASSTSQVGEATAASIVPIANTVNVANTANTPANITNASDVTVPAANATNAGYASSASLVKVSSPNASTAISAVSAIDRDRLASLFVRAASSDIRVRARPVNGQVIDVVAQGEVVQVVEPAAPARVKVGVADQWVKVRTADGFEGYTAAWLYNIEDTRVPDATLIAADAGVSSGAEAAAARLFITPKNDAIRVRAAPVNGSIVSLVNTGDLVEVLEPVEVALPKVGVNGQWIEVRDPDGESGYTAAWLYDVAEMAPVNASAAVEPLEADTGTTDLELVADDEAAASASSITESIPPLDSSITALGVTDSTAQPTSAASDATAGAGAARTADAAPDAVTAQAAAAATEASSLPSAADVLAPVGPDDPQTLTGELVNPIMPVTIDVVDEIAVQRALISVNSYPLATFTTTPFEFDLDTSLLSAGEYQLSFTVEDVDGMAWSDDIFFEVAIEDGTSANSAAFDAVDSALADDSADSAVAQPGNQPESADAAVGAAGADAARRVVTIGGVERRFDFQFSIADGLMPAIAVAPERELVVDSAPESLADVLTTPFLSAIPAPVRSFLLADRPTEAAIVILIMVLILIPQGVFTLYWMTYTWNNPNAAEDYSSPREFTEPEYSFTALVPARHEEAVIKHTIRAVDRIDYPDHMKEILVLIRDEDDDETIRAAQEAIDELGKPNIRLITFTDGPRNKPNGLNKGLREATKDVVCIFDAEDEPHRDVYNVVNTVMVRDDADVVQSGVQLMNFRSSWFSAFNVLEYFFWFKSGLHAFTRQFQVTPLGGNTVFFKRHWLERVGGWDDQCLTEDADIGLRLTQLGAKIQIVYDAEHSTQEETPDTVDSFIKQRTRWAQGFYQVFFKWDWARLPTLKQKIVALYILLNSLLQAAMILFIPVGLVVALTQDVPVPVALISYIPIYILLLQLLTSLIGIREFTAAYNERLPMFFTLRMIVFYYPYQLLLSVAAFRAVIRMVTRQQAWEKTAHSNLHRQSQLGAA